MPRQSQDPLLLQAALIGLHQMQADIDGKVSAIRRDLGTAVEPEGGQPASKKARRKKRKISAAGRANIVAALKKRWAMWRKEKAKARVAAETKVRTKPKRKSAPQVTRKAQVKPPAKPVTKKASMGAKRAPARKAAARKTAPRSRAKVAVKKAPVIMPPNVATPPAEAPQVPGT